MINFPAWIHRLSHQIPLYLKNIAVFDVMKYWYSGGIQQVFDDKNDGLSTLQMLVNWCLSLLPIKHWCLIKWVRVWI